MNTSPRTRMLLLLTLLLLPAARGVEGETALDRYIRAADPSYGYRVVKTVPGNGVTTSILEMTSQTWLTEQEVDRPVWKHWMTVVRPEGVRSDIGLLFIGGGANGRPAPSSASQRLVQIALATRTVVAELQMVPNQPLRFAGDARQRVEDALIAFTWDKYLRTGDERWPARLPMTKAAVRAMDTITAFCAQPDGGRLDIRRFVVAGASKRGWTTWTTAAVDPRVIAILPIVIDTLNIKHAAIHGFNAYGFFSPAIHDYIEMRLQDWFGRPQYDALLAIEDPYEYRRRLSIPKFIINATGDQFFVPDSWRFYFDDLPGAKYLRYVPNTDHSLRDSDAQATLLACYQAIVQSRPLPRFSWSSTAPGSLKVTTQDRPAEVKLWQTHNPNARDFRLETIGRAWKSTPLNSTDGVYSAQVTPQAKGWTAYFIELTYRIDGLSTPMKLTTGVYITPDTLPHRFQPANAAAN